MHPTKRPSQPTQVDFVLSIVAVSTAFTMTVTILEYVYQYANAVVGFQSSVILVRTLAYRYFPTGAGIFI
jgi:hypothetical protein